VKCRKGLHEMTEDNTKLDGRGFKHCRACIRKRKSEEHEHSIGVGRQKNNTALNRYEIEMDKALEANPPVIVWHKDKHGVMRHVFIDDPHAERSPKPEFHADYYEPECTDETLLAAARTGI
jgi:predicted amidohydrolase YtcJ